MSYISRLFLSLLLLSTFAMPAFAQETEVGVDVEVVPQVIPEHQSTIKDRWGEGKDKTTNLYYAVGVFLVPLSFLSFVIGIVLMCFKKMRRFAMVLVVAPIVILIVYFLYYLFSYYFFSVGPSY